MKIIMMALLGGHIQDAQRGRPEPLLPVLAELEGGGCVEEIA